MVGLLAMAAAFYGIAADRPLSGVATGPPHAPIDAESRAQLDRVLREAER
jgi:hypothetical protein